MKKSIKIGMRVKYSIQWLRSIAPPPTDSIWRAQGTIAELRPVGKMKLARISWDPEFKDLPQRVLASNLSPLKTLEVDPGTYQRSSR
jgi:hypothetical protein